MLFVNRPIRARPRSGCYQYNNNSSNISKSQSQQNFDNHKKTTAKQPQQLKLSLSVHSSLYSSTKTTTEINNKHSSLKSSTTTSTSPSLSIPKSRTLPKFYQPVKNLK